jgi:hypothetical protein
MKRKEKGNPSPGLVLHFTPVTSSSQSMLSSGLSEVISPHSRNIELRVPLILNDRQTVK